MAAGGNDSGVWWHHVHGLSQPEFLGNNPWSTRSKRDFTQLHRRQLRCRNQCRLGSWSDASGSGETLSVTRQWSNQQPGDQLVQNTHGGRILRRNEGGTISKIRRGPRDFGT